MDKLFGEIREKEVSLGDWLRVPYYGNPLSVVEMKVGDSPWRACYHDDGDVMIRVQDATPGIQHEVNVSLGGQKLSLGRIVVPGKAPSNEGGSRSPTKVSVRRIRGNDG